MSVRFKSSFVAQVTLGLAVLVGGFTSCEAAGKARTPTRYFDDLLTPSMLTAAENPPQTQRGGVKFFSINSVLAKLDGKAPSHQPLRIATITNDAVASDAPAQNLSVSAPLSARSDEPFDFVTFRAPEGVLWRKWRGAQADITADLADIARCKSDRTRCSEAANRFLLMLGEVRSRNGIAAIETTNRLVNGALRYVSDLSQHGELDVWTAPLAALGTRRGDCEDYVIAKFALLREAGIPDDDLRVLLVRDRAVRDDHAVLAVRHAGVWQILDNRRSALATSAELPHFTPLYALNERGVQLFASPYLAQRMKLDPATAAAATEPLPAADTTKVSDADAALSDSVIQVAPPFVSSGDLPLLM
jgi:predicted transglutaminase-like cysteine proteinase